LPTSWSSGSKERNVRLDIRENARANTGDRYTILRKYGYPPDKQKRQPKPVLEQAEVLFKSGRLMKKDRQQNAALDFIPLLS
jgi:hypothetical protein